MSAAKHTPGPLSMSMFATSKDYDAAVAARAGSMSTKHTPGPWSFAHRVVPGGMHHTQVFCSKGVTIASFAWYPMPTVNGVTGTYRQGNACLCAAAPELLAALKKAVETTYSDTLHAEWSALIARATGEQA